MTISPEELQSQARIAHDASGLTQRVAAERIGVKQPVYAQALAGRTGLDKVRVRIIEEFGGKTVQGPVYILREAEGE